MKENGTKLLETDRLILRKFEEKDAEDYFKNWVTDEVTHAYDWFYNIKTLDETKDLIKNIIKKYNDYSNYFEWAIELKDNHEVIGHIGTNKFVTDFNFCEIGYSLSSKYFRQGLMSEALNKVTDYLLNEINVRVIEARVNSENEASINLLKKNGFNLDAILPKRVISKKTKKVCDSYIFSKIKD